MYTARIRFALSSSDPLGEVEERALDLLATWYKNGQVIGRDWPCAVIESTLEFHVTIPEPTALEERWNNQYVAAALLDLGDRAPSVEVLGEDPCSSEVCACDPSGALVLFTTYLSVLAPVRCLQCFGTVPLYRLPHTNDHEHLNILHWAMDYRACDTLQMHCTTGERLGERQMSALESSLSQHGVGIARALEEASGRAVYYFLACFRARSAKAGRERKCPGCGSEWRLSSPLHNFDFRCDACRLVSELPSATK